MNRTSILSVAGALLLTIPARSQTTFVLPSPVGTVFSQQIPFGSTRVHHQFWFSAAQVTSQLIGAARITELAFWTPFGGQAGRGQQFEVRVAGGPATAASGVFQNNLISNETLVFTSRSPSPVFTTPTTVANMFSLVIPFTTPFEYDGTSGLTVDIRMFDNGNNDAPFSYAVGEDPNGFGRGATLWALGSPDAPSATQFLNRTPIVQFSAEGGLTVPFGTGCPGLGNVVPVGTTTGGRPLLGNTMWTQELSAAAPQSPTIWMIGLSRTDYLGVILPFDMGVVGATGCDLLVAPDLTASLFTVGGGAGGGTASLVTRVPALTTLDGVSWFSQWLILDTGASNGILAATGGLWHTFAQ